MNVKHTYWIMKARNNIQPHHVTEILRSTGYIGNEMHFTIEAFMPVSQ